MLPADIRAEPWVWVPFSRRRGRVLPTVLVAAVAAAAGYMMGRHSDKADVAPPQRTIAVSPNTQPAAVNSKTKPREAGVKPDLALKSDGETANSSAHANQARAVARCATQSRNGRSERKCARSSKHTRGQSGVNSNLRRRAPAL